MVTIKLRSRMTRRIPDPMFNSVGTERHIFFVPVGELPIGVPSGPVPRKLRTRWDNYREAQDSLLGRDSTPGLFHMKSRGITAVATSIDKIDEDEYRIEFADGEGIIDGQRTYQLIVEAQGQKEAELPTKQYVEVEVWTRVPREWLDEIAKARNTSVQVPADSLLPLARGLGWLKEELLEEPYFAQIAWSEYERGGFDIREILCLATCFDSSAYPNTGSNHPVVAYEHKALVVASFAEDYRKDGGRAYRRLRPILKDILRLHDTIALEFPRLAGNDAAVCPELVETSRGRPYEFAFIGERAESRLARSAVYPILAAFRWLVEPGGDEAVRWRGGYDAVLGRWRAAAERMIALTIEKCRELGGRPDALGRNATHWAALHREVAFLDFLSQREASPPRPAPPLPEPEVHE